MVSDGFFSLFSLLEMLLSERGSGVLLVELNETAYTQKSL